MIINVLVSSIVSSREQQLSNLQIMHAPVAFSNPYSRTILFFIIFIFTFYLFRNFIEWLALRINAAALNKFPLTADLGIYTTAMSKRYIPEQKLKHGLLLLHGFGASPQEFEYLVELLQQNKIPFYAPNIIGFGLNTLHILQSVRCEDWFRSALEAFDNLQMCCEQISILGHSMGAALGTFVAEKRKVKNFILCAPNLFAIKHDNIFKKILSIPVLSSIFCWLLPFLPKPKRRSRKSSCDLLDEKAVHSLFRYIILPVRAVRELFKTQSRVDIRKAQFENLSVIYGLQDLTVDNPRTLQLLRDYHISFEEFVFKNSAHNVFEDYEKKEASELVVKLFGDSL